MATHTLKEQRMETIWSILSFSPLSLRLLIFIWMIQIKEGWERATEKERMEGESGQGGGEVILESLNCNHHLQLLPPRCSNWTSTGRGREKVEKEEQREELALQRSEKYSRSGGTGVCLVSIYHYITDFNCILISPFPTAESVFSTDLLLLSP